MEKSNESQSDLVLGRVAALLSPEQTDVLFEDAAFCDVTGFVGDLIGKYDAKVEMFESERFVSEFYELFLRVKEFVDRGISRVQKMVRDYDFAGHYPEGWENRVRTMAYLAFYIHYGQERRAERDSDGKNLPYIFHILRAAFSDFARKVGILDEETLCAHPLHDSMEELPRGFFVRGLKIGRDRLPELEGDIRAFVSERCSSGLHGGANVLSYVDELTKPHELKVLGRFREHFEMFRKVCDAIPWVDEFSDDFLEALMLFCMKVGDMLDNHSSIVRSRKDDSKEATERVRNIMDEAVFLFLPQLQGLHMRNAEEWLRDQIGLADPEQRRVARENLAVFEDEGREFLSEFSKEFATRMNALGPSCKAGSDCMIVFRPRGIRNRRNIVVREMTGERSAAHLQGFNNSIVVVCLTDDERKKTQICRNAHRVLRDIFPGSVSEDSYRDERRGAFGRRFMFGKDSGGRKMTTGANFGIGSFLVCRTPKDVITMFYGDVHGACLYGDKERSASAIAFYKRVAPFVSDISDETSVLDEIRRQMSVPESPDDISAGVRLSLSDCVSGSEDIAEGSLPKLSGRVHLRALDKLMDSKIKALFARRVPCSVSVNGGESKSVRVPRGSTVGCALLYADFLRSCNSIESVVVSFKSGEEITLIPGEPCSPIGVDGPLKMNRILGFPLRGATAMRVHFSDEFNPNMSGIIEKFMDMWVLSSFKERLLGRRGFSRAASRPVAQ